MRWRTLAFCALFGCEAPTGGLGSLPPPPSEQACSQTLQATRVGHLSSTSELFLDDRAVLGPRGLYFGVSGQDGGNLAFFGTDGQVQLLLDPAPRGGIRTLEGSPNGVFWSVRLGDGRSPSDLFLLDAEGRSPPLGTSMAPLNPVGDGVPAPHSVDATRATFCTLSTIEILSTDDPTPQASVLPMTPTEPPYLRWPLLALTGAGQGPTGTRIEVYDLAQSWRRTIAVDGSVHNTVLTREALIFLDGGRAQLTPFNSPEERRTILERSCSSLDTDGEGVILACDPDPSAFGIPWLVMNHSLWLWKGGVLRELPLSGRTATLPRIKGDVVAYLSYGEADFCAGPGRGEVVVHDLRLDQTQVVGEMTQGCYCCDAFWPLPHLWLEDRMIAWNYDLTPEDSVGWGLSALDRECPD